MKIVRVRSQADAWSVHGLLQSGKIAVVAIAVVTIVTVAFAVWSDECERLVHHRSDVKCASALQLNARPQIRQRFVVLTLVRRIALAEDVKRSRGLVVSSRSEETLESQ